MKTYKETIEYITTNAVCAYLSGGRGTYEGLDMAAFIYGVEESDVKAACNAISREIEAKLAS